MHAARVLEFPEYILMSNYPTLILSLGETPGWSIRSERNSQSRKALYSRYGSKTQSEIGFNKKTT